MNFVKPETAILKSISQREWDYRGLYGDETEIQFATLYEYSRSQASIRAAYTEWLDSPIRKDCRELCSKHFAVNEEMTTPRDLLRQIENASSTLSHAEVEASSFYIPVYFTFPLELTEYLMTQYFLLLADFPEPYMEIRERPGFLQMKNLQSTQSQAVQEGSIFGTKVKNWNFLNLGHLGVEDATLGIDWTKPDRELVDNFRHWLKENRTEKACFSRKKYPGYALRCLATYKLKKLYENKKRSAVHLALDIGFFTEEEDLDSNPATQLCPYFSEQSQINRAVSDYNKFLTRLKISQENL